MAEYDHDEIVRDVALQIEQDKRYALVKYWVPWGDAKTDLIGQFYPDITCLRREGRKKVMIEVLTPYSFEDSDELRRLEGLSDFCKENNWEYYLLCPDDSVRSLTQKKIQNRKIQPKEVWVVPEVPFTAELTS